MIIELRGVEFVNKGAELMLHAIVKKIREKYPNAILVMEHTLSAPRKKHRNLGLYTKTGIQLRRYDRYKFFLNLTSVFSFFSTDFRRRHMYVNQDEIDVIFDASGFAYGDQWGAEHAGKKLADSISGWKKLGSKIILLSQAFGPFTSKELQKKMITIVNGSELVFARDEVSFSHLIDLPDISNDKIRLRPDFTNLIKGSKPNSDYSCKVAIIPNMKMITSGGGGDGSSYYSLLKSIITSISKTGIEPFFLIHESRNDLVIAERINSELPVKLSIVSNSDPLQVKGIIGDCYAVVTSRFHGLVSALCQSVPCLATGWSHKYRMLLKDYDYESALLAIDSDQTTIVNSVESILSEDSRIGIISNLSKKAKIQKDNSEEMWNEVFQVIG